MADTLREYLMKLGFKVDDASYKKWQKAVDGGAKDVAALGSTTVATATAIGISVEKIAREFEGLYYFSQRTREGVNNLKAYGFAAKQIGLDLGQSTAALDGFTTAQRLNPGIRSFVGLQGGAGASPVDQLTNFVEHQKKLYGESGYYVAAMNAELAGIPEATFLQIWNNLPKLRAANAEMKRMREDAGLSGNKFTEDSVKFTNAWDHLLGVLDLGKERIASDLIGPTRLGVTALDDIAQGLVHADRLTAGWAGTLAGLAAALGGTSAAMGILLRMVGVRGAFAATLGIGGRFLGPAAIAAWLVSLGIDAGDTPEGKKFHASGDLFTDIYGWLRAVKPTIQRRMGITPEGGGVNGQGKSAVIDYFTKQGWSRAAATGIAANLDRESGFNPKAIGDNGHSVGVAQWGPDRQAAFKAFAGKDVLSASLEEQLAFIQYELTQGQDAQARRAGQKLRGTTAPYDAGAIFSGLYERPKDTFGEAHNRGSQAAAWYDVPLTGAPAGDATIHQKTDIHITAPDPHSAGAAVASEQDRVNGDLVRNFQGMTR